MESAFIPANKRLFGVGDGREILIERALWTVLFSPPPDPRPKEHRTRGARRRADCEILWNDVSAASAGHPEREDVPNWFGEVTAVVLDDERFVLAVPNDFTREWIEGRFARPDPAAGRHRRRRQRARARARGRASRSAARRRRRSRPRRCRGARRRRDQPEVHVRLVRDRLVEPVRPRRSARDRRGAGAGVQPALHLRPHRARQDPPAARDRELHRAALLVARRALRHLARRS